METRRFYQGTYNIIRFNWHFFLIAILVASSASFTSSITVGLTSTFFKLIAIATLFSTFISLTISFYIYDLSGFYSGRWITRVLTGTAPKDLVNIHAGFDETSGLLQRLFRTSNLQVFDFYNPTRHTEISIKRARAAYPPYPGTIPMSTENFQLSNNSIDTFFNIFALHEIRIEGERVRLLRRQYEALRNEGHCIVVEHLRDIPNFLAYSVGFFHFLPYNQWRKNFIDAGFQVKETIKFTPFVVIFILEKQYGITP